ncbi:ion channel [Paenibacillus sp. KQZ6P-2]|uniref:Ion channel n=1 Tax=Paenibacillus mangrovi TaxID=2931978 RepID=A0A9X1WU82_9BACL|nr:ion channel [Paenibacillus mangrovi]MCJ8011944.1 ion channel [Paenibacillus mangrovi]
MHFFHRFTTRMMRMSKTTVALILFFFVTGSATIAYILEPNTFHTWFNALYWVMTTMATVGYGDYAPTTIWGKLFTLFLYVFGVGVLSFVIGKVIESIGSIKRQREAGTLIYHGRNQFIIINWTKKAKSAVTEILSNDEKAQVVIIDETDRHPMAELPQVHFISGDPSAEDTLRKAGLERAKAVIIFADTRSEDTSLIDGKSLMIASSIQRMAPEVHTTVEVMHEKHIQNFRFMQVNEFVLSHDAISSLAVRSALQEGNTAVLGQLIRREQGNDIYEVPRSQEWRTYGDAFQDLLRQGATLLADRSDMSINRRLNDPIPADARLYVVSDEATYQRITGK